MSSERLRNKVAFFAGALAAALRDPLQRPRVSYWHCCCHKSHRLGLRCWRTADYDGFCLWHNHGCFARCPAELSAAGAEE